MRTTIDFHEYRTWFYFFQYQFFVRSEQGLKRMVPESRIALFLRQLAYDPLYEHYRWETPTSNHPKKMPRKKPKDADPVAPARNGTVLYRAKKSSIRQMFMLFDFPKGHRADQIKTLYKSLLVHDLLQNGDTAYSIAKMLIFNSETLPSISRLRSSTKWYDILYDYSLGPFEQSEVSEGPAIEKYSDRFLATDPQNILYDNKLNGEREFQFNAARSRAKDIERYDRIAHKLIQLAQLGQFNTFPAEIAHIK